MLKCPNCKRNKLVITSLDYGYKYLCRNCNKHFSHSRSSKTGYIESNNSLTDRQKEIILSYVIGKTLHQIASEFNLAYSTIRTQLRWIGLKLGITYLNFETSDLKSVYLIEAIKQKYFSFEEVLKAYECYVESLGE